MLKLGVNIDHVATLREARYRGRGFGEPDPVAAARICEAAGAHGITAHLREDRRHIQDRDVWKLRETVKTRLNLEMANVPEIVGHRAEIEAGHRLHCPGAATGSDHRGRTGRGCRRKTPDRDAPENERRGHRGQFVHRAGRKTDQRQRADRRAIHRAAHGTICGGMFPGSAERPAGKPEPLATSNPPAGRRPSQAMKCSG